MEVDEHKQAELDEKKRSEIMYLLTSGLSQRAVARRMSLSVRTVGKVFKGTWKGTRKGKASRDKKPSDRCPGCGRMISIWPCLDCMISPRTPTARKTR